MNTTLIHVPKETVERIFDSLDTNKDLLIDHQELYAGIDKAYPFFENHFDYSAFVALCQNIFVTADTHTNGVLTYLELLQFFTI